MLKVVLILDNKIASNLSPVEFVKRHYLTDMAISDLEYIKVEQGDDYPELLEDKT